MNGRARADRTVQSDPVTLRSDPTRVLGQLFVPGHALVGESEGKASRVVAHVLGLSDVEVKEALADIELRFGARHRDLPEMFRRHAERLANRVPDVELSEQQRLLLGATFTLEYAIEATSVCNPSAVPAVDQTGLAPGELRFVLSIRQIGEGHRSSVGFRQGVLGSDGRVEIDPRGPFATAGTASETNLTAALFRDLAADRAAESARWVLDGLGAQFTTRQLHARLHELEAQQDTRRGVPHTVSSFMERAARSYAVTFPEGSPLEERVLTPSCAAEANGIEDARFVRFTGDDGAVTYYAPYTAYDGVAIRQQLFETTDFVTFRASPLIGEAAGNKGLALFPRPIAGSFHALSRSDGALNSVARSDDIRQWSTGAPLHVADRVWSCVQVGNCGSPIELDEGWLVLTHGVGPMRTYSIGALLLDLDDPTIVLGQTDDPLIAPTANDRDGYVPNVVYSCGALRHADRIVVPLGVADSRISFVTLDVTDVLDALTTPAKK